MSQLAQDIIAYSVTALFWLPLFAFWALWLVYLLVSMIKTSILKKEYYKTLSREDKDVIDAYKSVEWSLFKNNKKNEEKK